MATSAMPRERLFALRETIARIEGKPLHAAKEAALKAEEALLVGDRMRDGPANLDGTAETTRLIEEMMAPGAGFMEIRSEALADGGTAGGFALALTLARNGLDAASRRRILMIANPSVMRETGLSYAPGLGDFGAGPGEIIHAMPRRIEDALWLADCALSCGAFSAVIFEVHGNHKRFGLTESRRFSLKARDFGGSLILLRQGGEEEASSAALRLKIKAAPAAQRIFAGLPLPLNRGIGNPVFHVFVEKSRIPFSSDILLEWNRHDRRLCAFSSAAFQRPPYPVPQFPAAFDRPDRTAEMGALLAFDRAS